jgi:hypothetical protein
LSAGNLGKVEELVARAKSILSSSGEEPGKMDAWQAFVAVEYAILDLKLRSGIEGQTHPARSAKRAKRTAQKADIDLARTLLGRIDFSSDKEKLLFDLRACRDVLKSIVASYGRRSITS